MCNRALVGALPIVETEIREAAGLAEAEAKQSEAPKVVTRTRITADGTYATESVYSTPTGLFVCVCMYVCRYVCMYVCMYVCKYVYVCAHGCRCSVDPLLPCTVVKTEKPALRKLLLEGDFFLGAACACALTKIALRLKKVQDAAHATQVCKDACMH